MVTRQQSADEALREFQEARRRIENLMRDCMRPYVGNDEFEETQARVAKEMAHV